LSDDAVRFVSQQSRDESNEPNYDEDEDQLKENQEADETTTNQIFDHSSEHPPRLVPSLYLRTVQCL
jgi:hypothetical protein